MRILGRLTFSVRQNKALGSKALKEFLHEFAGLLAKACNRRPLPEDWLTGNATPA